MATPEKSKLVPRESLADAVYARIRDEIMQGDVPDGSRLSQVELAERYGVSRIPVREALRRLQAESLVVAMPYHPFVVRKVTAEQVLELVDIRAALEDLALAKRAPLTEDELDEMRRLNQEMAQGTSANFRNLDRRFHELLAGPETLIVAMIDEVRDRVHKYVSSMTSGKSGRTTATEEHTKIIAALEKKDVERARKLLTEHVMKSRAFIVDRLAADSADGESEVKAPARRATRRS